MLAILALLAAIGMLIAGIFVIPLHTDQWQLWLFWSLAFFFVYLLLAGTALIAETKKRL